MQAARRACRLLSLLADASKSAPGWQCARNASVAAAQSGRRSAWNPSALQAALQQHQGGLQQQPIGARGWAADAAAAEDAADDASLAPCERGPQRCTPNELDARLAEAGQEGGTSAVLALINSEGERFTERNVVSALAAIAAAQQQGSQLSGEEVVRSPAFQALIDMVLAGMQRFEPGLLAEAVWSCGQLGASEEMLLDEIGRHLMRHTDDLSAADVAKLSAGYAALDHAPSLVLFDSLAARAVEIKDGFSAEQQQQVAQAYERLGYGDKVPRLG